ncbi:MAG TPA: hypothetical protein VN805_01730 [Caulobacteraceae bacterium]|nr:hypothetical protein [Caulobacteraceae bacterium]
MMLRFTRVAPDRHRFEYRLPDGDGEAIELETHTTLYHDLLHYAVETQAGLRGSFYGLLAKVGGYAELVVGGGAALGGEVAITEALVGVLTGALKADAPDPPAIIEQFRDHIGLFEWRMPSWLTEAFVQAVAERMRQLEGRWRATPFGETMELSFALTR